MSALADRFGISIYAVNLTDFDDKSLLKAISDVPPKSLILFEDIDCMRTVKMHGQMQKRAPLPARFRTRMLPLRSSAE